MPSPKIVVDSPLGQDGFVLRHMTGSEELGRLFSFELELLSQKRDVQLKELLGQDMTVHVDLPDGKVRHFHGYVTDLHMSGGTGRLATYRVTLRPFLWFLTRTANSRIYQNLTVPDIIKQLLRERGMTDFDDALSGRYRTWDYLVQYRETDFNFISRLMEQEGIYYYFRHEQGKHTLVLADGFGAHHSVPGYEEVPYFPPQGSERRERDCVDGWQVSQQVQPGTYVLDDYDFKRPKADLTVKLSAPSGHERDAFEMYDYPGEYQDTGAGENYVRVRLEELHAEFERTHGLGNARGLQAGTLFKLVNFPREDQNVEYLVTSAHYDVSDNAHESATASDSGPLYRVAFTALKSSVQFRSARSTPKPVVWGPQTAKVVGKSGEEIWTDEHGRVKVRFHWDRGDTKDENSSCWVRVSQAWAGAGWGAMHVPRIGQEVIVSFLEGDPDRPLITGRVYNGTNKPPFALPGSAKVSGFKSDSSPGGGGNNEISFDDTKGAEKITIHGQWDMSSDIGNDQTLHVTNNRTTNIDVDDTETIGGSQTISVGGDQNLTITGSQTVNIGPAQTVDIKGTCTTTIGAVNTLTVKAASTETVTAAKDLTVGGAYTVVVTGANTETLGSLTQTVGGAKNVIVKGASSEGVTGAKTIGAKGVNIVGAKGVTLASGTKFSATAGSDMSVSGKKGVIDMGAELTIKVGSAQITLKKSGEILIKGKKITVDGGPELNLKGSKINQN